MQNDNSPSTAEIIPARHVRLAVWIGAVVLGLVIPLQILALNYLPPDDALRHVAKVISGKSWSDIVVIRDGFAEDQHPGWHAILGAMYRNFNPSADELVMFSVVALFGLWWLALVAPRRRPEAMLVALFVAAMTAPATLTRLIYGRPFIFAMVACVILLQLWTREDFRGWRRWLVSVILLTLSVWIHGSWFLWGVVCVAFALAGQWRKGFGFGICVLAGTFLAGVLAGRPIGYPLQTLQHMMLSFGGRVLDRMLVGEFKPDPGDQVMVMVVLLALVWRVARGQWKNSVVCNPIFMLAVLGWLLGLKVSRFWTDWGFPAALLWLAMEVEAVLEEKFTRRAYPTFLLTGLLAGGVYIATVRDISGRWTSGLTVEYLTPETPDIGDWLPEKGGTIFATDMDVFYRTFYKNPHAEWRYMLAFEPGLMPPEDLEIFRKIQWRFYTGESLVPWVKKMRPEDRMVILRGAGSSPGVPGLEWHYAVSETWIGRLPRTNSVPAIKP